MLYLKWRDTLPYENNLASSHSKGCCDKNCKQSERWAVAELGACDTPLPNGSCDMKVHQL